MSKVTGFLSYDGILPKLILHYYFKTNSGARYYPTATDFVKAFWSFGEF